MRAASVSEAFARVYTDDEQLTLWDERAVARLGRDHLPDIARQALTDR